jgi:hypothetical protein
MCVVFFIFLKKLGEYTERIDRNTSQYSDAWIMNKVVPCDIFFSTIFGTKVCTKNVPKKCTSATLRNGLTF